jgi:methylenetetrahydrofolate dehydrogenase (NADP+)/methenyltetrahydrofolate cyclohydrolase
MVGKSNIVGKPMVNLLASKNATVTLCNKSTKKLKNITNNAQIIIFATGNPLIFNEKYFCKNSIIIDIGINNLKGKIVGDVDFLNVYKKVKAITPVPGGVGPMTIAMLIDNTLLLFKEKHKRII